MNFASDHQAFTIRKKALQHGQRALAAVVQVGSGLPSDHSDFRRQHTMPACSSITRAARRVGPKGSDHASKLSRHAAKQGNCVGYCR